MTTLTKFIESTKDEVMVSDIMKYLKENQVTTDLQFTIIDLIRHVIINEKSLSYNEELFNKIMKYVTNVNVEDSKFDLTAIMYAADKGRYGMLKTLLKKGAKVDFGRRSALYLALRERTYHDENFVDFLSCAEELIKAGANIKILEGLDHDSFGYKIGKYFHHKYTNKIATCEQHEIEPLEDKKIVTLFPKCSFPTKVGVLLKDTDIFVTEFCRASYKLYAGTYVQIPENSTDVSLCHVMPSNLPIKKMYPNITDTFFMNPFHCRIEGELIVDVNGEIITLNNIYQ